MMTTEEWNDKQTGSNDGRADLSSPLGAVAMRDAVIALAKGMRIDQHSTPQQNLAGEYYDDLKPAIEALPLPTHADLLAHAMRLPEVAAMREALDDMCIIAKQDDWDKSLSGRQLAYRNSCTTLAALEAKP